MRWADDTVNDSSGQDNIALYIYMCFPAQSCNCCLV